MDRERLLKRLLATFLEELGDNVGALNRDLLSLEKADDSHERGEILKGLFRTAHSLKGAARSANIGPIEQACHALESTLAQAQTTPDILTRDVFAVLFAAADALEEAGQRLREQQDLGGSPLVLLLPRLDAVASGTAPVSQSAETDAPVPAVPAPVIVEAPANPPTAVEEPPPAPLPQAATPAVPLLSDSGGSVRVPAEKLDAFLGRSGALLVARRRVAARLDDIATLRQRVTHWKAEWLKASRPLESVLAANDSYANLAGRRLQQRLAQALADVGDNLEHVEEGLERLETTLAGDVQALKESAVALDEEVRRVRMLPFAEVCEGLDRMVRDLARGSGKEVQLVLEGGGVELDRSILQGLRDPLRHLVRNAVDHGAETPEQRRAAGKPPQATLTVAAVLRGAQVEVMVSDDGQGLDLDALRRQLRKRGLAEPADERELARAVFLPGLSTSRLITDISGRGVGLDVVKSRVEALHGTIDLCFARGKGTRFTLAVPLTLTTLRAVLLKAAGQTFAFVDTNVQRLVRIKPSELRFVEGRQMLSLGGPPVPVASLADTLGMAGVSAVRSDAGPGDKVPVVLVAAGDKRMAFVVDELLAEQEIVVKGLGSRIRNLRHVSGATLLASGGIALVLNAANLVRTALARAPAAGMAPLPGAVPRPKHRLLVVDDSLTTRTLEQSILETAGYEVTVAADGTIAWQLLQDRPFDLVVSDVDMPRMDGFALTEAIRRARQLAQLPVVLVTARASEDDRTRGLAVGANAYLVKSAFDQTELLRTIVQLL